MALAPPPPRPVPTSYAPPAEGEPRALDLRPWGLLVLLGAVLVVASQVVALTEAFDDDEMGGKETAMFVLAFVGNIVIGLALLAAGCFTRGSFGGRVALLAVGAYLLTASSSLSYLRLFGFGGVF